MQLAEYAAEDGGHFDWHIDQALQGTDLNQRKIFALKSTSVGIVKLKKRNPLGREWPF